MRQLARNIAAIAVASTVLTGAAIIAAPAASAVPPGWSFQWGALSCTTTAHANGNGTLTCTGTRDAWWRARVKCSFGYTYYGTWQNNWQGGTRSSTANSGCFWGVEDISISVPS